MDSAVVLEEAMAAISLPPKELPTPHPPSGRKRDLYYDPVVFRELDEDVFKVRTLHKCVCFLKLHKSVNVHAVHNERTMCYDKTLRKSLHIKFS